MNTFRSKDNINVSSCRSGINSLSTGAKTDDVIELCKKIVLDGWIYARKTENRKRREIYVSKVTPEEIKVLKERGLLRPKRRQRKHKVIVPHTKMGNMRGTGNGENGEHGLDVVSEYMLCGAIGLVLKLKGYRVVLEKPFSLQRIDIYAEKGDEKLVIEVESSASSYREGLRQLSHVYAELRDKAKYVLVLPTANEQIRNTVESLGFMLWTLDDIMKDFCKLSKGEK